VGEAVEAPLPTREQLRAFLRGATGRVGKSDIARHFGLSSDQRPALRELLRGLKDDGQIAPVGRRGMAAPDRLPEMTVVEVVGTDADGDAIARPVQWDRANGPPPAVFMAPERRGMPALAPRERVLGRLSTGRAGTSTRAHLQAAGERGAAGALARVFEEGRIIPTGRRSPREWVVPPEETTALGRATS
jgi:ribonuclease R